MWPVRYMNLRLSCSAYVVILSWLLSLLICLPPFLLEGSIDYHYCHHNSALWFGVYSALGAFYVPLSVIILCYSQIFLQLWKKMVKRKAAAKKRFELLRRASKSVDEVEPRVRTGVSEYYAIHCPLCIQKFDFISQRH